MGSHHERDQAQVYRPSARRHRVGLVPDATAAATLPERYLGEYYLCHDVQCGWLDESVGPDA